MLLGALAIFKPDYDIPSPTSNQPIQRSIIGQTINDSFAQNATGLVGCINESPRVDYERHLAQRWDAKIRRHQDLHPDVPGLAESVQERFREGPRTRMSLEERLDSVQQTISAAPVNWTKLGQKKLFLKNPPEVNGKPDIQAIKDFQEPRMQALSYLSEKMTAPYFMAITMTEFFASHNGQANAALFDHMLKDAGVEYVLSLPANDKHRSYTGQQVTWSSVEETNTVHDTSYDVMNLSGNQDIEVSYLHSLAKSADILRELHDDEIESFKELISSDEELASLMGAMHYKPVQAKKAVMHSLQSETPLLTSLQRTGGNRLAQYAQKMQANLHALKHPQPRPQITTNDFEFVGYNSKDLEVHRYLRKADETACEITTAFDQAVSDPANSGVVYSKWGVPTQPSKQDTLYVLATPKTNDSRVVLARTQEE